MRTQRPTFRDRSRVRPLRFRSRVRKTLRMYGCDTLRLLRLTPPPSKDLDVGEGVGLALVDVVVVPEGYSHSPPGSGLRERERPGLEGCGHDSPRRSTANVSASGGKVETLRD